MKNEKDKFTAGYICAVATMINCFGMPSLGLQVYEEGGFSLEDLKHGEAVDRRPIRKEWKNQHNV